MNGDEFWYGKKIFITGHTGFKGGWLSTWLTSLGAEVTGFALSPQTNPNLYELLRLDKQVNGILGDVRDSAHLKSALRAAKPEVVFHLAAQPLVRVSYNDPVQTYSTNMMGTVHLLEAIRQCPTVKSVVIVTTDKCYANQEWSFGYRETDPLGGADPYSSSKACVELITEAYRDSFFHPNLYDSHGIAIASARAGNVIGGGDWSEDRLIPDCLCAIQNGAKVNIRNPEAVRPWQHVLEPLQGYLILAKGLCEQGPKYSDAWNFGPAVEDAQPVRWIVERLFHRLGYSCPIHIDCDDYLHETRYLRLDTSKSQVELGWRPKWDVGMAIDRVGDWFEAYISGENMWKVCFSQIEEYNKPNIS